MRNRCGERSSNNSTDTRDEFLNRKGLGHIVIAPRSQSCDTVFDVVLGGQKKNGNVLLRGTNSLHDLEPVKIREHDVKNDDVGVELTRDRNRITTGCRGSNFELLVLECNGDEVGD